MRLLAVALIVAIPMFVVAVLPAQTQQQSSAPASVAPETIAIGQSLDSAIEILRRRSVEFGDGHFAFAQQDPDSSCLRMTLDPDHSWACLHYSKLRRTVTGLSMIYFPSRVGHDVSHESWVSAQAIHLYPDASYAVHFTKPATLEQLKEQETKLPKSVTP